MMASDLTLAGRGVSSQCLGTPPFVRCNPTFRIEGAATLEDMVIVDSDPISGNSVQLENGTFEDPEPSSVLMLGSGAILLTVLVKPRVLLG